MTKVNYDPISGIIKGFYPETIKYVFVPEPFIEIGEEVYKTISVDSNNWRVNAETLEITKYEPTEAELKQPAYMAINADYSQKIAAVCTAGITATKQDSLIATIREQWKAAILSVAES